MIRGQHPRGAFRVIEGGGDPTARQVPERDPSPALAVVGIVAVSWFACVGVAWTAYVMCRALGLVKP